MSSAERKPSGWDTVTMCKDRRFMVIYGFVMSCKKCYFGVEFPRCFTTREINTTITLSWALKQFVTQVHTLLSICLKMTTKTGLLDFHSLSGWTSYPKISWDSGVDFSNRSEIWQAPRQQRRRDACQIAERYGNYNIQSCGFEASRDLVPRRLGD